MQKKRGISIAIMVVVLIFMVIMSSFLLRLMTPAQESYSLSLIHI